MHFLDVINRFSNNLMLSVNKFVREQVVGAGKSSICILDPGFWDILTETEDDASNKIVYQRLYKYLLYKQIFSLDFVFVFIADDSSKTWAVLILCGLKDYGKKSMARLGGEGFGALFYRAAEVPDFQKGLRHLNTVLELEFEKTKCKTKIVTNLIENENIFEFSSSTSLTENMNMIFVTLQNLYRCMLLKSGSRIRVRPRTVTTNKIEPPQQSAPIQVEEQQVSSKKQLQDEKKVVRETRNTKLANGNEKKLDTAAAQGVSTRATANKEEKATVKYKLRSKTSSNQSTVGTTSSREELSNGPLVLPSDDEGATEEDDEFFYKSKSGEKFPFAKMDLESLAPHAWLNDSVINFYLRYLLDNAADEVRQQVYLFSTYFYPRLQSDVAKSTEKQKSCIRSWKLEDKILDFKYAAIPIHENDHWYLAILVLPRFVPPKIHKCTVYILNSMLEDDDEEENFLYLKKITRAYLAHEYCRLKSQKYPVKLDDFVVVVPPAPQQRNGSDCGLFLLEYFEQFLKVLESNAELEKIAFANWFSVKQVSKKRAYLRNLINSFSKKKLPARRKKPQKKTGASKKIRTA